MKRSKSYTWLSTLLKPKVETQQDEEWGAVPWIRANEPMQND
ncbi:Uncharacterized protein OBRU01_16758, partial [Operophtera brumata]